MRYITSPSLLGFSLIAEDWQTANILTLINLIHDPLIEYLSAYYKKTASLKVFCDNYDNSFTAAVRLDRRAGGEPLAAGI
jgi:hypothetical protein